jgi:hypothetical protein
MVKVMTKQRRKAAVATARKRHKITLSFSDEQLELINRAAAHALDNRAHWGWRRLILDARAELGLPLDEPSAKPDKGA